MPNRRVHPGRHQHQQEADENFPARRWLAVIRRHGSWGSMVRGRAACGAPSLAFGSGRDRLGVVTARETRLIETQLPLKLGAERVVALLGGQLQGLLRGGRRIGKSPGFGVSGCKGFEQFRIFKQIPAKRR